MEHRIVIHCCTNSTLDPEEHVEAAMAEHGVILKMVRLPCSGRTDILHILRVIEDGADMAMVVGCSNGHCRFLEGNVRAEKRVKYVNRLLAEAGLGLDRVKMYRMDDPNGGQFAVALQEMIARAKEIGPWLSPGDQVQQANEKVPVDSPHFRQSPAESRRAPIDGILETIQAAHG